MKLTDFKIKNLTPKPKDYKVSDGKGLYLYVLASGGKSWRYDYKLKIGDYQYKNGTFTYGTYPEVGLAEAREKHFEIKKLIREGIDPNRYKKRQTQLQQLNNAISFKEVSKEWLEKKRHEVKPNTIKSITNRLNKEVYPFIGNIPIGDLGTADFLFVLKNIEKRGTYEMLYKTRQYCGQILRYAVAHGIAERDFTVDLKEAFATRKTKHQPALKPNEMPEFLEALSSFELRLYSQTRLALKMLMLTFVRPIELVTAEWAEIDFENKLWIIPADKMKMNLDHVVPLADQTLRILHKMSEVTRKRKYVFVGQHNPNKHMNRDTLSKAVRSLGFQGRHTPHGFRALARTTIREKLHWDSEVIERQLAHVPSTSLGRTYDRTQFLDQRITMMQEWADYIEEVGRANLVKL